MKTNRLSLSFLAFAALRAPLLQAKPLKVFILAGQSNMEGHAEISTFPAVAKDPKTADLYKQMVDAQGKPVVCKDVWISYACHGSAKFFAQAGKAFADALAGMKKP